MVQKEWTTQVSCAWCWARMEKAPTWHFFSAWLPCGGASVPRLTSSGVVASGKRTELSWTPSGLPLGAQVLGRRALPKFSGGLRCQAAAHHCRRPHVCGNGWDMPARAEFSLRFSHWVWVGPGEGLTSPDKPCWLCYCRRWCFGGKET